MDSLAVGIVGIDGGVVGFKVEGMTISGDGEEDADDVGDGVDSLTVGIVRIDGGVVGFEVE